MSDYVRLHASAVALDDAGVLIFGASGSGKSGLALQLMAFGARLISDDQVDLSVRDGKLWAQPPDTIAGLIEARGVGILKAEYAAAPLHLAVNLDHEEVSRLPPTRFVTYLGVALPCLHKCSGSAWPASIVQFLKAGRESP